MGVFLLVAYLIIAWLTSEVIRKHDEVIAFLETEELDQLNPNLLLLLRTIVGLLWLPLMVYVIFSMYKDTFDQEDDEEDDDDDLHPDLKLT